MENDKYTYQVFWSQEDQMFVGICLEFRFLSWLAYSAEEAFKGIRSVVQEAIEVKQEEGDPIPQPLNKNACVEL